MNLQRHWSAVWVGAWDGTLKHVLLVERIGEDGAAGVIHRDAGEVAAIGRGCVRTNAYRDGGDVHRDLRHG